MVPTQKKKQPKSYKNNIIKINNKEHLTKLHFQINSWGALSILTSRVIKQKNDIHANMHLYTGKSYRTEQTKK